MKHVRNVCCVTLVFGCHPIVTLDVVLNLELNCTVPIN